MSNQGPKIGLALSGGSGRAITHIGVLEVLCENNIPIDYISACSSGTIIAASFVCGTMEKLKQKLLKLNRHSLSEFFDFNKSESGLFSLEKMEEFIRQFTLGKTFEEIRPNLWMVACDIETGEPVNLMLGDLAKACRISCSLPLWFPPVQWGNRILVDGGLFRVVPVNEAREMGADIVIGIDIAATRLVIKKRYLNVWRGYRFLKNSFLAPLFGPIFSLLDKLYDNSIKIVFFNQSDFGGEELLQNPNMFSVLGRAMEIVDAQQKRSLGNIPTCDIMLSPKVKDFGKVDFVNAKKIYEEGRRVTQEAIPEIKKLIADYQWRKKTGRV